ncbi:MAG: hypothetical protein JW852_05705 [Spirochaetales bacterium]|nr:hypothetical protein [Spirochaetales bacterium]
MVAVVEAFSLPAITGSPPPENYEVRSKYRDLIFAPRNEILAFSPVVESQFGESSTVSMQMLSQNDSIYLLFTNEEEGDYPLYSRGSYVIRRDWEDGAFSQIKVFIRSEPGSFVRIRPAGRRSLMDVYLLDALLYKGVVLPLSVEQISVEPFSKIVELTRSQVDWELLFPFKQRPEDSLTRSMIESLRAELKDLRDSDDGAIDEDGAYRYIDSLALNPEKGLNCSGFAKWVIDGLYQQRTGKLLSIESLRLKHPGLRGTAWSENYEQYRDPYFGLDWSRNLAATMLSLDTGGVVNPEAADVRSVPFFDYFEDVGYRVRDLKLVLFFLAVTEPGHFYIGSVNSDYGASPVLKQHVHLVVLFPHFDEQGAFQIVVMERNAETSIESLESRYATDHTHLVRLSVPETYAPPTLNFKQH